MSKKPWWKGTIGEAPRWAVTVTVLPVVLILLTMLAAPIGEGLAGTLGSRHMLATTALVALLSVSASIAWWVAGKLRMSINAATLTRRGWTTLWNPDQGVLYKQTIVTDQQKAARIQQIIDE